MAKHVSFTIASVAAGSTMAMSPLSWITDFSLPGSPAWEGAVDLSFHSIYGDMIEALLPVAIVCAVSLLWTAVWLLAAGAHLRSRDSHAA